MRIAFLLPGLHRVHRGAEVAFESIAAGIASLGLDEVTVYGGGPPADDRPYRYEQIGLVDRRRFERFPHVPPFRTQYVYEEATWALSALRRFQPGRFDVSLTCSYPFVNALATRMPWFGRGRSAHVFVTENGDHPALTDDAEYRFFRCDGLVCTNPVYFERQRERWRTTLIPNGIDPAKFCPGPSRRAELGLPEGVPIVLIVGALIDSKRVIEGLRAVASIPGAHLVVAGDGPLREDFEEAGERLMPGRHRRLVLPADRMPDLYRSADVLLHPALFESFGNIYVEAMAVGLPVVAHESAVTRWLLGDDDPGLVDSTHLPVLTAAVEAALAGDRDRASARVADVHRRFAWSTIAADYRSFLDEVVSSES